MILNTKDAYMVIYDIEKKTLVIPQGFQESTSEEEIYERGVNDGKAQQKALLSATTIINNGEYTRADGWSAVTVDVPQNARLTTLNRTPMPAELFDDKWIEYSASATTGVDGWDNVKMNLVYIIAKGEMNQKAKLASKTITENGEYTRADGWSAVTVNVPEPEIRLQDKTIQTSGVYTADSGYTGLGTVTVTPHIQAFVSGTFVQLDEARAYQLFIPTDSGEIVFPYITIDGVQLIDGTEIITVGTHTFEFIFGNSELPPFKFFGQVEGPIVCDFYPRQ